MSNYFPVTSFSAKDALTSGNPLKALTGTAIGNEFVAVQTALNSKFDGIVQFAPDGTATQPSFGLSSVAGTGMYNAAGVLNLATGGVNRLSLAANGALTISGAITATEPTGSVWGSATGGAKGAGSINAQGLFVNGAAVVTSIPAIDANTGLTGTTLNSGVVNSSLTSVGTLGSLTVTGNVTSNGQVLFQTGSFTATIAGCSAGGTGTINYTRVGKVVTLTAVSAITGTSNAVGLSFSGLPAACQPATGSPLALQLGIGNTATQEFYWQVTGSTISAIIVQTVAGSNPVPIGQGANSFVGGSGTKGLPLGWTLTYTVD